MILKNYSFLKALTVYCALNIKAQSVPSVIIGTGNVFDFYLREIFCRDFFEFFYQSLLRLPIVLLEQKLPQIK